MLSHAIIFVSGVLIGLVINPDFRAWLVWRKVSKGVRMSNSDFDTLRLYAVQSAARGDKAQLEEVVTVIAKVQGIYRFPDKR